MEEEILQKLQEQEQKIDKIYKSVESTRKYFMWMNILTIIFFVLPLIIAIFMWPLILKTVSYSNLGL